MIQLTRSGAVVSASAEGLKSLRREFDRRHCIRLPQLLEPELLRFIQRQIEQAEFYERRYDTGAVDLCMKENTASALLHFLVNNVKFFKIVQHITGCGRIGCCLGSVYTVVPGFGHCDCWHNDLTESRMLAMAVNLSTGAYSGGVLQIRDCDSGQILHEVANRGFGDAIVLRIAPHMEHRVSTVEGSVRRTTFACWFLPQPDYRSWFKLEQREVNPGDSGDSLS